MASIQRRTVRWTTQEGHQRTGQRWQTRHVGEGRPWSNEQLGRLDTWQRQHPDVACLGAQSRARDDVMKVRAIHETSKALLETMEQRQRDTREALKGQGHGKH